MTLTPGSSFAGYRIDGVAGRGGMGVVYRAQQDRPKRSVALKVIASELSADPAFRARFDREAELAASIEHPNIAPVNEVGEHDGQLFIAMRFVDGSDLATILRDGPLSPERAVAVVERVASALAAAHHAGLVHRDVKPANVLVRHSADGDEHVYLTDFGLARRPRHSLGVVRVLSQSYVSRQERTVGRTWSQFRLGVLEAEDVNHERGLMVGDAQGGGADRLDERQGESGS